jgi:hypothetical protein
MIGPGGRSSTRGKDIIAKLGQKLALTQTQTLVVKGYTDNNPIGPALKRSGITSNQELSQKRADEVMQFLISQGVNPQLVSAQGFGDSDQVASNDTTRGRAQNRRIEITIQDSQGPAVSAPIPGQYVPGYGPLSAAGPPPPGPGQPPYRDPRLINVLYATNRAIAGSPVGQIDANEITDNRSPTLAYGSAVIRVPEAHKIGQVERPSDRDIAIIGFTISKAKEDEKKNFVAKQFINLTRGQFIDTIKHSKGGGAMLFVHGIATPFSDAIFKTAQIAFDTNFPGVPITFAWPTKGTWLPTDYNYDQNSATYSGSFEF